MEEKKAAGRLRRRQLNTKGFTLVELVIVIAIIAILAAVLVPQYVHYVDKSREAVCRANRTEEARALALAYRLGGRAEYEKELETYQNEDICPKHGDINFALDETEGEVVISCSVHTGVELVTDWTSQTMATVMDKMGTVVADHRVVSDADSGAIGKVTDSRSEAIQSALAGENIDLAALGATSWHYDNGNNMFYWTSVDISTLTPGSGTKVPTLRYNADSGTYTVWYCTVETKTTDGATYNVLKSPSPYTPSTTDKDNQTYEQAQKYMDQAMSKYNGYN
jgi:prepilin-type N-terminal cleavage/methylation domain-containing protein